MPRAVCFAVWLHLPLVLLTGLAGAPPAGGPPEVSPAPRPAPESTPEEPAAAAAPVWRLGGDLRLRLESDRSSTRPDGSERPDRERLRARARLALEVAPGERLSLGLRLRTGSAASQQSPHVTLDDSSGGPTGDADLLADRWVVRWSGERSTLSLGRDTFPFWRQNELGWDDDATPAGLAAEFRPALPSPIGLALRAALLAPPDGGRAFHGRLAGAQAIVTGPPAPPAGGGGAAGATERGDRGGRIHWTAATGLYRIDGEPGARHLLDGNGARDYLLWTTHLQVRRPLRGRPLILGVDLYENLETYPPADPDPVTAAHHDRTTGYALSARWDPPPAPPSPAREDRARGWRAWSIGYTFARLETLAVHASYAQDDWVRWGTATQTRATGLRGHELRLARDLLRRRGGALTLVGRLFVAESLVGPEDGTRVRVDLDYRF